MTNLEEKRMVALNFTKHILVNKLINKGKFEETELVNLYADYQTKNPSNIKKHEIIDVLSQACLIKSKTMFRHAHRNGIIEFKDRLFESPDGISAEVKDYISPRIRVRKIDEVPNGIRYPEESKTKLVNKFGDLKLNGDINKKDSECRLEEAEKISLLSHMYRTNRKYFNKQVEFLFIPEINVTILGINKKHVSILEITNKSTDMDVIFLAVRPILNVEGVKISYELGNPINPGQSFRITFSVQFKDYGHKIYPIVLKITNDHLNDGSISVLVEPQFVVSNEEIEELAPSEPYKQQIMNNPVFMQLPTVVGEYFQSKNALLQKLYLPSYPIRATLKSLFDRDFRKDRMLPEDDIELNLLRKLLCNETMNEIVHNRKALNINNYVKRFEFLLWAEEYTLEREMQSYNQSMVQVKLDPDKQLIKLEVPGLSEGRPSILKGDKVYVREKVGEVRWEGVIHNVDERHVYLSFHKQFRENYLHYQSLDIEFGTNKNDMRMCHRALRQLEIRKLTSLMFPSEVPQGNVKKNPKPIKKFFNGNIANNREQVTAIQNIVSNTAFPAPYILFGPPGTGKTATIVEAIVQIWNKYKRSKKICVCAPSNSAADLITKRLLQYKVPSYEVMRLYGLSRSESEIPDELKKCSNFDRLLKEMYFPSKKCIEFKTIIILTPVTAGRLVTGGITGGHFDYLFMDEAGHAVEPEMIVPIAGLLTTANSKTKPGKIKGSLILAGDHKQLGPVIQSKLAVHVGLDMSLLERLMIQSKLYQKNENKYNPMYITKLVNNYRSHGHILHIPNMLFYDNELRVAGDVSKIGCALNWRGLPQRGIPIIFHSVKGREERESNSPSYFNRFEVAVVGEYVDKLVGYALGNGVIVQEQDVGVITPYKKQVQKLRQYFRKPEHNCADVTVASVEEFQGQERLVIIISTVRSRPNLMDHNFQFGLGFLKNAKRFNVAVTRAAALLIVVGNPDILICDPNWRALIQYCIEYDSYVGEKPSHSVPHDFQPKENKPFEFSALVVNSDVYPRNSDD